MSYICLAEDTFFEKITWKRCTLSESRFCYLIFFKVVIIVISKRSRSWSPTTFPKMPNRSENLRIHPFEYIHTTSEWTVWTPPKFGWRLVCKTNDATLLHWVNLSKTKNTKSNIAITFLYSKKTAMLQRFIEKIIIKQIPMHQIPVKVLR